jgi:Kef-type K+ transport system membrane component KefB/voltage-gated potassium channel Kch
MESHFVTLFGILLIIITAISFLVKILKQPIIIGYVLSGLAFAIFFASEHHVTDQIVVFSEVGIMFLLFLMGLEFDLKSLKYLGKDLILATFVQSTIFWAIGFGCAMALGFDLMQSAYLGILLMFSSTLLVAKWIDDKKETQTLHGKMAFGMLIIEDIIAILVLTVMSILSESSFTKILFVPLEGVILVVLGIVMSKYLLNYPLKIASKYPELLFLFGIAVCFFFVEVAPLLGYSTTIGAFIGGVVLANTLYKTELLARLKPLVTFFNMLFFVGLGFQVGFDFDLRIIAFIAVMLLLNLFAKPFIIYFNLRYRGYDMKTSFLCGIYMSQLSEFGIIILAGALAAGQITPAINSIAIISVILTMIFSSYLIKYDKQLLKKFEPFLIKIDKRFITKEINLGHGHHLECHILLFGYYELGKALVDKFKRMGKHIVVVENDPENADILRRDGVEVLYGSVGNPDFFEHHNFEGVEMVISSLTDIDDSKNIILEIKKRNPHAVVVVTAKNLKDSLELYKHDADYVIYTSFLNEQRISVLLDEYTSDMNKIVQKKAVDLRKLKEKDAKLKLSKRGKFTDIDKFISDVVHKENKNKPAEKEDEDDKKKKPSYEFRSLGERYL